MQKVPFFSLAPQWATLKESIMPRIMSVLDSQQYVGGPIIEAFEKEFATYTESAFGIACNSGTDALWIALKAIGLEKDQIVLTTPFSFIASSSEIVDLGGHPVFIDIDKETFNIDPVKLELWLSTKTEVRNNGTYEKVTGFPVKGIVAVNIFGNCAQFKRIRAIAQKYNLWIVEDAAQSISARDEDGTVSGNLGDITCFSFYPTKNLGGAGDGGMMTTNDPELAAYCKRLRNHGRANHYNYEHYGLNSRLDTLQAVILSEKLKHLESFIANRQKIAQFYTAQLSILPGLVTPRHHDRHTYHQYTLQIMNNELIDRTTFLTRLSELGIETRIFYPQPLHQIPYLETDARLREACPIAEQAAQSVFSLPLWPEMGLEMAKMVTERVSQAYGEITHETHIRRNTDHA